MKMNYEIVELQEKTVVGLIARTNNADPNMGAVIGGLWEKFYQDGVYSAIDRKRDGKALGIYTDYAGTEKDDYNIMVACEVEKGVYSPSDGGNGVQAQQSPEDTVVRTIPAGKYAKFIVTGDMQKAVYDFWCQLWTLDLPRNFECDFEEYQNDDMEHAEIHIYIGLKE